MMKEKVNDLNHKRENEVMELKNKIDQMQLSNEALIEDYEKKISTINETHNQEIRAIISGKKNPEEIVGNTSEEKTEKSFFATEIEKTEK